MIRLREWAAKINFEGELIPDAPLAGRTTFNVGGPADLLARPVSETDVQTLLRAARAENIEVTILGGGSNILISDNGIRGLVIDATALLGRTITESGIHVGAGESMSEISAFAADTNRSGLEFIYAMPGSVGGAVWMNARCYGGEIVEILESVQVVRIDGTAETYVPKAEEFGYKLSPFMSRPGVMTAVSFRLGHGDSRKLWEEMRSHEKDREEKGHFEFPCAGSIFKNNRQFGNPSGAIIDSIGLRGFAIGKAKVSDRHANIIQNTGGARAHDIRAVIEHVSAEVERQLGLQLEREVLYVGDWGHNE